MKKGRKMARGFSALEHIPPLDGMETDDLFRVMAREGGI
jgi:hypothetical protein